MKLPDALWRTRAGMPRLLRALGAGKGEIRFVGGCVRDTLLGLDVSDVDLASRLTPDEVIARLTTFPEAVGAGKIKVSGDPMRLDELMMLMDEFPRMFEIVEPKRAPIA